MENFIIKASSQMKIPKITWTLILELIMKKPMICIYNSFLIFRTIPQFKLSHEHKKRQQFSVYKPEEEKNRCWEVSQRLKNTTFLSTLLSFISLSKRKLNTTTWKEKTRRFWLDLPPSHEMTSTCSSYLPICSPQKIIQNIL